MKSKPPGSARSRGSGMAIGGYGKSDIAVRRIRLVQAFATAALRLGAVTKAASRHCTSNRSMRQTCQP